MKKILIYGSGGHAKSVSDILLTIDPKTDILFIDDNPSSEGRVLGFPVQKPEIITHNIPVIICIGENKTREKIYNRFKKEAFTVISPKAYISRYSKVLPGTFAGNFAHIGPDTVIGENCIINNGAIIEHDCIIGNHSHIAPHATIAGNVYIGERVFIGTGATVINNISIGRDINIGAGATVTKSIDIPGIYIGTPARKVRE